jgi:carbonic anhydrase
MRRQPPLRQSVATLLLGGLATTLAPAQDADHHEPPAKPAAETKNGAPARPTHAPQLELPPLVAWHHVRAGNEALVAAQRQRGAQPEPQARPAGAGRYVCAAIVCADADVDVPWLLGLRRRDVLLLTAPGPFVQPEAIARLEQAVADERLSLVLVIGHDHCRTLKVRSGVTSAQDALAQRVDVARREAERTRASLVQALVRQQCQQIVAASDLLRDHVTTDTLRVLPAELDTETGALTWLHARIDEYALRPIR